LLVGVGGWVSGKQGFSRHITPRPLALTLVMQSADLLAGKEGSTDPTELIELIEDLTGLEEADAVADRCSSRCSRCIGRTSGAAERASGGLAAATGRIAVQPPAVSLWWLSKPCVCRTKREAQRLVEGKNGLSGRTEVRAPGVDAEATAARVAEAEAEAAVAEEEAASTQL
jgi:hypothetical protein